LSLFPKQITIASCVLRPASCVLRPADLTGKGDSLVKQFSQFSSVAFCAALYCPILALFKNKSKEKP
jgi:hypothetical protein